MFFITPQPLNSYKIVSKQHSDCYGTIFFSFSLDFPYRQNTLYITNLTKTKQFFNLSISKRKKKNIIGFHSYTSLEEATSYSNKPPFANLIVVKCIIPAGSKVYKKGNIFISNKIILKEEI